MAPAPTGTASGPGASPAVVIDLGMVGVTPGGSRVTVYSFGPSDHSPEPPAGYAWLEADIEWCLTPTVTTDMSVGQVRYELVLELRDDATIVPDATAGSPDEVYSSDGTLTGNECVRGALVFAVESGAIPEYLVLQGASGGMRWALA